MTRLSAEPPIDRWCVLAIAALLVLLRGAALAAAWPRDWKPQIYPVPADAVRADRNGVRPDQLGAATRTDNTDALERLLGSLHAGQTLFLPAGMYYLHAPLLIPSGVGIQGQQDPEGHPLATLVQTQRYPTWQPGKIGLGVLINANYTADTIHDAGITVTALAIKHESYGTLFRAVRNVLVRGCLFDGGQDGVASLDAEHVVVSHDYTINTSNAAYDFWEGVSDVRVEYSVAHLLRSYGISFNATSTIGAPRTSRDLVAVNNIISGAGDQTPAIYVDPLHGSRITGTIIIANNQISQPQPGARTGGIFVATGEATLVDIEHNSISGSRQYPPILVQGYRNGSGMPNPGRPAKVIIKDNTLEDNIVANGHGALVPAQGTDVEVSGNTARGNRFSDGRPPPFVRSEGIVHLWDNSLAGLANDNAVPPQNLRLHAP
jgi:hypothetical protein